MADTYTGQEIIEAFVTTITTSEKIDPKLKSIKEGLEKIKRENSDPQKLDVEYFNYLKTNMDDVIWFKVSKNIAALDINKIFHDLPSYYPLLTGKLIEIQKLKDNLTDPRCLIGPNVRGNVELFKALLRIPGVREGAASKNPEYVYSMNQMMKGAKEQGNTEIVRLLSEAKEPKKWAKPKEPVKFDKKPPIVSGHRQKWESPKGPKGKERSEEERFIAKDRKGKGPKA